MKQILEITCSGIPCIVTFAYLASIVQTLDSAIHQINLYPLDNAIGFPNTYLAPVVQTLDSAIHWINHYPVDKY